MFGYDLTIACAIDNRFIIDVEIVEKHAALHIYQNNCGPGDICV